jgi:predicted secreted protein
MVGKWIDAAVQAGANRVDSVYFSVSPDQQNAIRFGLISDAVSDARNKAMTAATLLGMEVVDVLDINLDSYSVIYQKRGYEYAGGASSPSTPIIPGTEEISTSVHATFEIAGYSVAQLASNTTVSTSVNEDFQITLDSNPSTGYRWLVTSLDETVVRLVNDEYIAPGSSLVGASGNQVLTFEALKEGQILIKMEYARPWEPQSPQGIYYVDVIVSANP